MTHMKLKKPLKDPNAKSPIQKFFGGKIPHYLAVVAFLYVLVDGGGSFLNRNAEQKARESIETVSYTHLTLPTILLV